MKVELAQINELVKELTTDVELALTQKDWVRIKTNAKALKKQTANFADIVKAHNPSKNKNTENKADVE